MSVRLMGEVWGLDVDHARLLILLALADHADDRGRNIFPSLDLVAWKTGYTKRWVRIIVAELRAKGVLIKVRAARHHQPAHYELDLKKIRRKPPLMREEENSPLDCVEGNSVTLRGEVWRSRGEVSGIRAEAAISSKSPEEPSSKPSKNRGPLLKKAHSEEPQLKSLYQEKLEEQAAEARKRRESRAQNDA